MPSLIGKMIDEVIGGEFAVALKKAGYKKSRRTFVRRTDEATCTLEVQAGAGNLGSSGRFTVNMGVGLTATIAVQRAAFPRPDSEPMGDGAGFGERLGSLATGKDYWWGLDSETDLAALSRDLAATWEVHGRPWLDARSTLLGASAVIKASWEATKPRPSLASSDGMIVAIAEGNRDEAIRRIRASRASLYLSYPLARSHDLHAAMGYPPAKTGAEVILRLTDAMRMISEYEIDLFTFFERVVELEREYPLGSEGESVAFLETVGRLWDAWLVQLPGHEKPYLQALHLKKSLAKLSQTTPPSALAVLPAFQTLRDRVDEFVTERDKFGVFVRIVRALSEKDAPQGGLADEAKAWITEAPAGWVEIVRNQLGASSNTVLVEALRESIPG